MALCIRFGGSALMIFVDQYQVPLNNRQTEECLLGGAGFSASQERKKNISTNPYTAMRRSCPCSWQRRTEKGHFLLKMVATCSGKNILNFEDFPVSSWKIPDWLANMKMHGWLGRVFHVA